MLLNSPWINSSYTYYSLSYSFHSTQIHPLMHSVGFSKYRGFSTCPVSTAQTAPSSQQPRGCHFPDLQMLKEGGAEPQSAPCCYHRAVLFLHSPPDPLAHFPLQIVSNTQTQQYALTQSKLSIREKVYAIYPSLLPEAHRLRVFLGHTFRVKTAEL